VVGESVAEMVELSFPSSLPCKVLVYCINFYLRFDIKPSSNIRTMYIPTVNPTLRPVMSAIAMQIKLITLSIFFFFVPLSPVVDLPPTSISGSREKLPFSTFLILEFPVEDELELLLEDELDLPLDGRLSLALMDGIISKICSLYA